MPRQVLVLQLSLPGVDCDSSSGSGSDVLVWDLDSTLPFPCPLQQYAAAALHGPGCAGRGCNCDAQTAVRQDCLRCGTHSTAVICSVTDLLVCGCRCWGVLVCLVCVTNLVSLTQALPGTLTRQGHSLATITCAPACPPALPQAALPDCDRNVTLALLCV